jgi:dolichol-phosphate mannosyltransferase
MPVVLGTPADMIELSIVIAAYRSEGCIAELNRQLVEALEKGALDFEIIYVEDHGGDGSWDIIAELARHDPRVKGIKFCRNFGHHYALSAGLDVAEGNYVVIMDCDLQDRPDEIQRLYDKAQEGFDVVLARRIGRTTNPVNKLFGTLFYKLFDFLTGTRTDPAVGTFRILSRKVVDTFRTMQERHRFFGGMIQWMGFKTASIDVAQSERFAGKGSYTLSKRLALAIDGILSFSNKPLILMIKSGIVICCISGLFACWIVYQRLTGIIPELGYASIIVSIYFLAGIIMLSLGVVGAYVGRIYDQVKGRPYYIIERTTFDA